VLAAIITTERVDAVEGKQARSCAGSWPMPWARVEVLGKSAVARFADSLRQEGCDAVSVIGSNPALSASASGSADYWVNAELLLANQKQEGFDSFLIACCGAYVELDLADMRAFHDEHGDGVTRAMAPDGPLDLWMVDPSRFSGRDGIFPALREGASADYPVRGYVNRLESPSDFRRLVLDGFSGRCRLRPYGTETRPGVWICEGAQIGRGSRIVAPAYIGRNVQIMEDCLITRGTNVESNSQIDFGTAVEDTSILSSSYVGIGLDLCHSIVDGSNLINLRHNVTLEITDPVVMRKIAVRGGDRRPWAEIERGQMALSAE